MQHILKMARNLTINFYLRPYNIAIYRRFYLYSSYLFRFFQMWYINYVLYFGSVKMHKKNFYIGVYLVLTYIERLFPTDYYFLNYFTGK